MTPAELSRLSTLLDQALDLTEAEREPWLAALQGEGAALAPTLRELLARHVAKETADLLDRGPAFELAPGGPQAGDAVGPYRLLHELGAGGMGAVWLAERSDGSLTRKVALKLPHLGWARGLAERFTRECEILASLEHPHIARLYDAGLDARGRPYMALEYVEGQPIDVYCRERALPVADRLRLLLQVAAAVAFAHGRLVLHRDLKPANILVTAEGQVRLLDFGVAKLMQGDRTMQTALTQASGRALTPDYASPEQIRGETMGTASDVYSLAVVAYELLTGARPYRLERGSAAELEEAIAAQDVPLASQRALAEADRQALRGDLDAILNRALKKPVEQRYGSAEAFAQDIRRHLDGQRVQARPDTLAYRLSRVLQRHRVPLAAGAIAVATLALALGVGATALVIAALGAGLGAALWQARRAGRARDRALVVNARNEAVSEFLNTLLTQVARSGQAVTAEQMLARSEELLEREFKHNPEHRAVVLAMMGMNAHSLGDPHRSVLLMERAVALVQGSSDRSLLDKLVIQRAVSVGWIGRLDEARATLKQVVARESTEPDNLAEAHHYLASLAHQRSDAAEAAHHAEQALWWLRRSERPSARMETSLIASLGHACHLQGRNDEADRHYADALARMQALGQERNAHAMALINNWALVHEGAGDPRRALELYERALRIAASDAPDSPKSPFTTANRARALELLGRFEEAEAGYAEALQLAERLRVPPVWQYAQVGMASLALERQDLAAAADRLAQADQPAPAAAGTKVALLQSLLAIRLQLAQAGQAMGGPRAVDAAAAIDRLTALLGARPSAANTVMALLARAEAHGMAGQTEAAQADADDARSLAVKLQGSKPGSLRTGLAWLQRARMLAQGGDGEQAVFAAGQAVRQFEAVSVACTHPAVEEARGLAGGIVPALAPEPGLTP